MHGRKGGVGVLAEFCVLGWFFTLLVVWIFFVWSTVYLVCPTVFYSGFRLHWFVALNKNRGGFLVTSVRFLSKRKHMKTNNF